MIDKNTLESLYIQNGFSVKQIATKLKCSSGQVNYWLEKHSIKKRTISQAVYLKSNPYGDPFNFNNPNTAHDWFLYGLGLGIFWGEGNKANTHAVRLGNTDPGLLKVFLDFLNKVYKIDKKRLRFGLQIFNDIDPKQAKRFWMNELSIDPKQFQLVVVTRSLQGPGTYRKKSQFGVLTIYFSNKKLRDTIVGAIDKLRDPANRKVDKPM